MQLKNVIIDPELDCPMDDKKTLTLDEFDRGPGYYKSFILPMLSAGHEGELINWMKTNSLIPTFEICNNIIDDMKCEGRMVWINAKIVDQFQWKCMKCKNKRSIRQNSIFQHTRCRIKESFRIFYGFARGIDAEVMAKLLGIKKQLVSKLYEEVAYVAKNYIEKNITEFKIGGQGVVVLVDTYPSKNMGLQTNCSFVPILCLAEIKNVPTRYWFHVFDKFDLHDRNQIESANCTALHIIQNMVHPQSILVTNANSPICSYYTLQSLKHLYPIIVTVDGLKRHNNQQQTVENNLDIIWRNAVAICEEAQYYSPLKIESFFINHLWRQRFENDSFEMLIHQMCYNFV